MVEVSFLVLMMVFFYNLRYTFFFAHVWIQLIHHCDELFILCFLIPDDAV